MKKLTFKNGLLITASLLFAVQIGGCDKNCPYDGLVNDVKTASDNAKAALESAKDNLDSAKKATTCESATTYATKARDAATKARDAATEAQTKLDIAKK